MMKMTSKKIGKNDTIGIFYETPTGRIAFTCGWNGSENMVEVYYNEPDSGTSITYEEWQTWKPRKDLWNFPDSLDPLLPYDFDLHYDIKYMSQLKSALERHENEIHLRELMEIHDIKIVN